MSKSGFTYLILFIGAVFILSTSCEGKKTDSIYSPDDVSSVESTGPLVAIPEKGFTVSEFLKWCTDENNGLVKIKTITDLNYSISYMPSGSMAALELRTEKYDLQSFLKVMDHYTDMSYFKLKIESPSHSGELLKYKLLSPHQYESRIKYLSFEMQNDIYIIQDNDTLRPGLYQYERAFEAAPYATIMMGFDNKKFNKEKQLTLCFNDRLFEKGYIKFNYLNGQMTHLPKITEL